MQLNPKAFGLASAIFAAGCWFLAMSFSLLTGIGKTTISIIGGFHPFFYYSWLGMIIIVIEHLIGGFITGWIFAWLYNKLVQKTI